MMDDQVSGGQEANRSGLLLHNGVAQEFKVRGVPLLSYADNMGNEDFFARRRLIEGAPYTTIYDRKKNGDFLYVCEQGTASLSVRIQCMAQHSSGSADEKIPYLLLNALKMQEHHIWLVLDGDGFKDGAREWLKNQARAAAPKKIIEVMTLLEARARIKKLIEYNQP